MSNWPPIVLDPEGAIALARSLDRCVLALGADMKHAAALGAGDRVLCMPSLGALESPEAADEAERRARFLVACAGQRPDVVAFDAHPDMRSSALGRRLAAEYGVPVLDVQHHHAHAVACLAENAVHDGMALVMDGTGWGPDGTIWGAELLEVRPGGYRRLATFDAVPLPGGDAAVRSPARQLAGRWAAAGMDLSEAWCRRLQCNTEDVAAWHRQAQWGINAPLTRAAGRLFDAFAAALGLAPAQIAYEGQPAIRVAMAARFCGAAAVPDLPFAVREESGLCVIDWAPAFRALADPAAVMGREAAWALALHRAVAGAAIRMIEFGRHACGATRVALSGGVFMNGLLTALLVPALEARGLTVLAHRRTSPGDDGLALGQAVVAGSGTHTCVLRYP